MKLRTIQKHNVLNEVYVNDEPNPISNGHHSYTIYHGLNQDETKTVIQFQDGPRAEEGSIGGVLDGDLIEIVKHRQESFQAGKFHCPENEEVIKHLTLALMYMNKRAEERAERNVLGKHKV